MKIPFSAGAPRLTLLALLASATMLTTACKKDETTDYAVVDENIIKQYLADNNITTAQRQSSGLYYLPVTTNASGDKAVAGKTVSVLYTGKLTNGQVFDASKNSYTPIKFILGQGKVIQGWDEGIALMRKGEKAELFIPSALAYGSQGAGSIPPNSVLHFEVELVGVQ